MSDYINIKDLEDILMKIMNDPKKDNIENCVASISFRRTIAAQVLLGWMEKE